MSELSETQLSVAERERALLAWLRLKFGEGMTALRKERAYDLLPLAIQYVDGKQFAPGGKALSKITDNRLRKLALETAATMTDVRPIWNYETFADEYQKQGDVLNQLARAWWRNNRVDQRLVSTLLYSLAGGSGYAL